MNYRWPCSNIVLSRSKWNGVLVSCLLLPFLRGEAASYLQATVNSVNLRAVAWTGSQWIASGDSGRIFASPDAVIWTPVPSITTASIVGIASSGSSIVGIGTETWQTAGSGTSLSISSGISLFSADGKNWSKHAFTDTIPGTIRLGPGYVPGDPLSPSSIFWSGSRYAVFIQPFQVNSDTISPPVAHSMQVALDGKAWRKVLFTDSSLALQPAGWFGTQGLAFNGATSFGATNDSTWSVLGVLPGTNPVVNSITPSGNHFVVVGSDLTGTGLSWISPDGRSWRNHPSGTSKLNAVNHVAVWTIAVGDGGALVVSQDDTTWTPISSGTKKGLRGCAVNDSLFVAVGDSGTILRIPVTSLAAAGIQSRTKRLSHALISIQAGQIEITSPIMVGASPYSIRIAELDGRMRWERHGLASENGSAISLPRFPSGAYLLSLEGNGSRESQIFTLP